MGKLPLHSSVRRELVEGSCRRGMVLQAHHERYNDPFALSLSKGPKIYSLVVGTVAALVFFAAAARTGGVAPDLGGGHLLAPLGIYPLHRAGDGFSISLTPAIGRFLGDGDVEHGVDHTLLLEALLHPLTMVHLLFITLLMDVLTQQKSLLTV